MNMFVRVKRYLICGLIFFNMVFMPITVQAQELFSVNFKNIELSESIRHLARFLHINVIISQSVSGVVTLSLHHVNPWQAWSMLLTSHGLSSWQAGEVIFVAPRDELIKQKQEDIKWQELIDASAPLVTHVRQIRYANAAELAMLLQDEHASFLSKRGHVRVDGRTNIICIQDTMDRVRAIQRMLIRMDVPVRQMLIEARLAAVDSDGERELGVDFSSVSAAEKDGGDARYFKGRASGRYSVAAVKLADGSLLDIKLAALEREGHAELISSPSLFTANQQPASIEAGEEVPYQEVSESGGTAVTFKKAVLSLHVTPQLLPGNRVSLQLKINQDRPSSRMIQGVPTISTRQITTNVIVRAGQTIVLGGIYEHDQENAQERVPFISRLPIVGWLFVQRTMRDTKRELLIFVTPKMIA